MSLCPDPEVSHASLLLPSGAHSITLLVHPPQVLGEGSFELTAVTGTIEHAIDRCRSSPAWMSKSERCPVFALPLRNRYMVGCKVCGKTELPKP
jgi:hypothetical protein